jgi:hypothetical protein
MALHLPESRLQNSEPLLTASRISTLYASVTNHSEREQLELMVGYQRFPSAVLCERTA